MKNKYPIITVKDEYLKIRQATKDGYIEFKEDGGGLLTLVFQQVS